MQHNNGQITVYDYMALYDANKSYKYVVANGLPPPKTVQEISKGLRMVAKNGGEEKLSEMFMELHPDVKGIMQMLVEKKNSLNSDHHSSCGCSGNKNYNNACGCHNSADGSTSTTKELSGAEILANAITAANNKAITPAATTPSVSDPKSIELRYHQYFAVGIGVISLIGLAYLLGKTKN